MTIITGFQRIGSGSGPSGEYVVNLSKIPGYLRVNNATTAQQEILVGGFNPVSVSSTESPYTASAWDSINILMDADIQIIFPDPASSNELDLIKINQLTSIGSNTLTLSSPQQFLILELTSDTFDTTITTNVNEQLIFENGGSNWRINYP